MTHSVGVADTSKKTISIVLYASVCCGDGSFEVSRENEWTEEPKLGDVLLIPLWDNFESDEVCICKIARQADTGDFLVYTCDVDYPEDRIDDVAERFKLIGFEIGHIHRSAKTPTESFGRYFCDGHRYEAIEELKLEPTPDSSYWAFEDHAGFFTRAAPPEPGNRRDRFPKAANVPLDVQEEIVRKHLHQLRVTGELANILGDPLLAVSCAICSPEGEELNRFVRKFSRVPVIGETVDVGTRYMCRVTNVTHTEPACGVVARIMVLPLEHLIASDNYREDE